MLQHRAYSTAKNADIDERKVPASQLVVEVNLAAGIFLSKCLPLIAEALSVVKCIFQVKDFNFPPVTSMRTWEDSSLQRSVHSCPRHKRERPIQKATGPVTCKKGTLQSLAPSFFPFSISAMVSMGRDLRDQSES